MFFRLSSCLIVSFLIVSRFLYAAPPAQTAKPKLVVAIIVDQFRYDYLTRFRANYHGGFDQLLTEGADFTNAFYQQVPTVTAVGHSIFLSGAMPSVSGIIGNSWYDRHEGKVVTSVCDWKEKLVGGGPTPQEEAKCTDEDPASPRRLLVSTLGDELRTADPKSEIIGVSIKPRGAILPSGHKAAGAYWFDDETGGFITSTFYVDTLPHWASEFNAQKLADQYLDRKWEGFPKWSFHAPAGSKSPYAALPASPWGNELIEAFAEAALTGEKLGQRGVTDLLTVSFSSNDYVGHRTGPDAPEVRDMAMRTDQVLAKLFRRIDQQVGLKNVLIVLSADHGAASAPKQSQAEKMPSGRMSATPESVVESALNSRFGKAAWLKPGGSETNLNLYLNADALQQAKAADGKAVTEEAVYRVAREALFADPQLHVARVYTRNQLESGIMGDFIAQAEVNGFNQARSGDIIVVLEPNYMPPGNANGTDHFSPYGYDRHVPVLFMGPGIKPGRYDGTIAPNDIAPTLATMLNLQTPSGSSGRVLAEMLTPR